MRLAALQSSLLGAATGRDECNEPLLRSIRADARAPVAERIAAYRANIRGAHLQALDSAFPVTREVLGPKYWGQLLESDVKASASASSDLNAYGGFVPALLATAQQHRPELRELPTSRITASDRSGPVGPCPGYVATSGSTKLQRIASESPERSTRQSGRGSPGSSR